MISRKIWKWFLVNIVSLFAYSQYRVRAISLAAKWDQKLSRLGILEDL